MSSQLAGIIERLRLGQPVTEAAVKELERLLDALRAAGWSGSVPADEAVRMLTGREEV